MAARQNRVASVFFPVASHAAKTPPPLGSRASPSAIPSLRSALTSFGGYSAHGTLGPTFLYGAFFFVVSALADVPSTRLPLSATDSSLITGDNHWGPHETIVKGQFARRCRLDGRLISVD